MIFVTAYFDCSKNDSFFDYFTNALWGPLLLGLLCKFFPGFSMEEFMSTTECPVGVTTEENEDGSITTTTVTLSESGVCATSNTTS